MSDYKVAPSTWLKNALQNRTDEKINQGAVQKLIKILDEEMFDGLLKHVQEKDRENAEKDRRLLYAEERIECKERELRRREEVVKEQVERIGVIQDERGRDAYIFAQMMVDLLKGENGQLQESMSYIMWAYLGGKGTPGKELQEE